MGKREQQSSTVKTYDSPKAYQKDLPKMLKQGWVVAHTSQFQKPRSMFAFWSPKPLLVVTYNRAALVQVAS